jgi:cytochrome c oxidase assembly protein subunit 15
MASLGLRLRKVRALALLLTGLSLLVVLLSAYLRLDGAGLGCADWPACYGALLSGEPQEQHFGVARLLHRAAASLSLLLACTLVWQCRRRPMIESAAAPATLLLLLMLALSALGIWSSDPRLMPVGFLNILGGLGLVSFSWRVVLASRPGSALDQPDEPKLLLRVGAVVLTSTLVLGALLGSGYAAPSCPSFPDCAGRWWPTAAGWTALQPLSILTSVPQAGDPGGVTLNLLHRYSAMCTLILLGTAAVRAMREEQRRRAAILVLVLLITEVALGTLTVISGFSLGLAISHGVCAAALLAAVATLLRSQVCRQQLGRKQK